MQILVLYCGANVVKLNVIRAIEGQIMNKDALSRLILIVQNQITSQAMKAMDLFSFKVEIFQVSCLFFGRPCLNISGFENVGHLTCCCQYSFLTSSTVHVRGTCQMTEHSACCIL